MDAYKVFLSAILDTGDPTKTNPREIITAIGNFLQKIMDSYRSIDAILKQFDVDNHEIATKITPILNNFPEGARNIFKALTEICLINEKAALNPDPNAPLKPGEAEQAIIDALDSVLKLLIDLNFLFKDDSVNPITTISNLFSTLTDNLRNGLLKNLGLFGNLKTEINFRYNVTVTNSECGYGELNDLIRNTYPGVSDVEFGVLTKYSDLTKQKFVETAGLIKISVLSSIDSLQALYINDIDRVMGEVNIIISAANDTLFTTMTTVPDKQKFLDCLNNDGLETVVTNVPASVLAAVEDFYDRLYFEETSLGTLSQCMDSTIQKFGRTIIRSSNMQALETEMQTVSTLLDSH